MDKHRLNIFPNMTKDDFDRLLADMEANGYDKSQPIVIYEGAILDGWNRYQACAALDLEPTTQEFTGTAQEALEFTLRTNKRRNLTSSQCAAIAVEADDVLRQIQEEVEKERRKTQAETLTDTLAGVSGKNLPETKNEDDRRANSRAAAIFGTNRKYIADAKRIKEADADLLDSVLQGMMTICKALKELDKEQEEPKPQEQEEPEPVKYGEMERPTRNGKAMGHAADAITALRKIKNNDPARAAAFRMVKQWVIDNE